MSTLTNIELRIGKLENKVRRLECQTCSSPLFYDTFEDFPTEGRNGFLYVDKETGGIYIWNGEYITLYEEKICLNETEFVSTDVNNPTTEEVKEWVDANLTQHQKDNGTQLTYFVEGDGGSNESPDFVWTLNKENGITLSNKRVFNSKTVYVDTSGSDITGKRGYREFPFKTLNAAINAIENGDTLYVFPGDYTSSVTVSKLFNIYCEDGVNWDATARLLSQTGINNTSYKLNWRFDNLFSSNSSFLEWGETVGINFITLEINILTNVYISFGAAKGIYNVKELGEYAGISSNTYHKTNTTVNSPYTVINIDNIVRTNNSTYLTPLRNQNANYSNVKFNINNINIVGDTGGDGGISNMAFAIQDGGIAKNIVTKVNNCRFYPTAVYSTVPAPFDNRNAWRDAWGGNQVFWIRRGWTNLTDLDYELLNYRGTGWGININGWHFDTPATSPTQQRTLKVKMQGYWERSAPVSIAWWGDLSGVNQPLNTTVHLELDVICDEAPGVMFFWYGSHPSNRFIISGRIVTKYTGMPCITLNNAYNVQTPTDGNFNSNGTILLKDLIMINDGTVAPIAINPLNAQVQEVKIMNVKSNSLIVDANITEIGESIVRNVNYN